MLPRTKLPKWQGSTRNPRLFLSAIFKNLGSAWFTGGTAASLNPMERSSGSWMMICTWHQLGCSVTSMSHSAIQKLSRVESSRISKGPFHCGSKNTSAGGTLPISGLLDLGTVKKIVRPTYVFGGNCFLPKSLIYSLGGFHPDGVPKGSSRYRGDGETGLMIKFENSGFRSLYDPRATAYHIIGADRLTIEYFCIRAFNQGISDSYTHIRNDLSIRSGGPR